MMKGVDDDAYVYVDVDVDDDAYVYMDVDVDDDVDVDVKRCVCGCEH